MPTGLVFQLFADSAYHELPVLTYDLRFPEKQNQYADAVRSLYARSYYNQAVYAATYGKSDEASSLIARSLEIRPDFTEALMFRKRLQQP